jgi:citrate synthase
MSKKHSHQEELFQVMGHAVLRNTDPRFMHLKGFADKHIKDDYICDLAR